MKDLHIYRWPLHPARVYETQWDAQGGPFSCLKKKNQTMDEKIGTKLTLSLHTRGPRWKTLQNEHKIRHLREKILAKNRVKVRETREESLQVMIRKDLQKRKIFSNTHKKDKAMDKAFEEHPPTPRQFLTNVLWDQLYNLNANCLNPYLQEETCSIQTKHGKKKYKSKKECKHYTCTKKNKNTTRRENKNKQKKGIRWDKGKAAIIESLRDKLEMKHSSLSV